MISDVYQACGSYLTHISFAPLTLGETKSKQQEAVLGRERGRTRAPMWMAKVAGRCLPRDCDLGAILSVSPSSSHTISCSFVYVWSWNITHLSLSCSN